MEGEKRRRRERREGEREEKGERREKENVIFAYANIITENKGNKYME